MKVCTTNYTYNTIAHCPTLLKWMSAIGAKFLSLGKHGKYLNDTALQIIKSRRENNTRKVY